VIFGWWLFGANLYVFRWKRFNFVTDRLIYENFVVVLVSGAEPRDGR